MPVDVTVPTVSPRVNEVTIVEWLKKENEQVKQGEPLLIVETEKVTVEVDSPASGVLTKIMHREGSKLPVNTRVAIIED